MRSRSDGTVGAIGGIQQKIVGAREDGAQLFLVPADNCDDAEGAHNGDMRLVKVTDLRRRPGLHRGLGQGPRRRAPELRLRP